MVKSFSERWDKESVRFDKKGPIIKVLEHATFGADGKLVKEGRCDTMEAEFRPYNLTGLSKSFATDVHAESCAELVGNEEAFVVVAREARDNRLVGTANGQVARAIGGLADGTGYLVDQHGRPIGRTPNAPITPMTRRSKDW